MAMSLSHSAVNLAETRLCDSTRILLDPLPNRGSWNMAVDEVLLEAAVDRGQSAVRLYRWSEATVSLGYFQPADALAAFPALATLPAVRRLSGGGAILHHHELTYSCALPASHELTRWPQLLYEHIHRGVIDVLSQLDIPARLRGEVRGEGNEPHQALFLCFGRGDARDVIVKNHKVMGSAQRRRRGAILQHGSLLLKKSCYVPQYAGLLDLTGADGDGEASPTQLAELFATSMCESIRCGGIRDQLTERERCRAEQFETRHYRSLDLSSRRRMIASR